MNHFGTMYASYIDVITKSRMVDYGQYLIYRPFQTDRIGASA